MYRKKRLLYGAAVAVFCLFWAVYFAVVLRSASRSSRESLQVSMNSLENQIDRALELQSKDLALAASDALYTTGSGAELGAALSSLEQRQRGRSYYFLDAAGAATDRNGQSVSLVLTPALQSAREGTYGIVGLAGSDLAWDLVAMVVAVPETDNLWLAEIRPMEELATELLELQTLSPVYMALFNEWGSEVAPLVGDDNAKTSQSVRYGAVDYVSQENVLIRKIGFFEDYNVFIPLRQPDGWFLGGRIARAQAAPLFMNMFQTSLIAFGVSVLLMGLVIVLDVYNDRVKHQELSRASKRDLLTGLHNSFGMEETVMGYLQHTGMKGQSLVYMDIAGFHRYNSMFGYLLGDKLLTLIGEVLKNHCHCGVRMGGDVFAFVCPTAPDAVSTVERRLFESIGRELGSQYLQMISFRFGVFPIQEETLSFRELYDGALLALRDAKLSSETHEVIYTEQVQQSADLRRNIEMNMLHALSKGEFMVYVQPKFNLTTGGCCGGEALVRWHSENLGFMPPDQFISLFEKNGFIVELDFFMLESVMQMIQGEREAGKPVQPISVNQSRITITFPNYLERLENLVQRYQETVPFLQLEITESALENDREAVLPVIHEIKALGFEVAMDDFGSGYSSLNTLRELPVDVLKIDKGFLRESDSSERSGKIIRSIIAMAKELDIGVLCEGVETDSQVHFLKEVGCEVVQGFYFSRPIPLVEYEENFLT